MNFDIVACGDLLTNYVYSGTNSFGIASFEQHPAGAIANLLAQAAALGGNVALISTLSENSDGKFLYSKASEAGIDMSAVVIRKDIFTKTVFVYFKPNNDRYFVYNGTGRSHFETSLKQIHPDMVKNSKIFAAPLSYLQTDRPFHNTVSFLRQVAKEHQTLLAVDVNYRGQLIPENERNLMLKTILETDIVKMTKEEMTYYLGESDLINGTDILLKSDTKLAAITLDKDGCFLRTHKAMAYVPTYPVKVLDTTGAGDSFMGSLLYQLTRPGIIIEDLTNEDLKNIGKFSNACASLSTTRLGSLCIMPHMEEAQNVLSSYKQYPPSYFGNLTTSTVSPIS